MPKLLTFAALIALALSSAAAETGSAAGFQVTDTTNEIRIVTPQLEAAVVKQGYVSGIREGSFLDKKTGFHDPGFGLEIIDWIMEPGSDEAYRDKLPGDLPYVFNTMMHGKAPKRSIEGPQICTQARQLSPTWLEGKDFVAIQSSYRYHLAAPGKNTGSKWSQTIVFPAGKRYFISSDRIDSVNASDAMFLRLDMPGHIRHHNGDTFSEVYLSYVGRIDSKQFLTNFPPDEKFIYRRGIEKMPKRFIRGYHLRDPQTGKDGPWLAGMTLDPSVVSEAWCHQRDYVCMIEEFGGRPIKPGEHFSAAFVVGYFDSIEEMENVYDLYAGANAVEVDKAGWHLAPK